MPISTDSIRELRERSGAGIMDCKRALEATDGAVEEAEKLLAQKGLAVASKKAGRTANQGLVDFYVHSGGKLGAMIEVNCETDFVARTDQFKSAPTRSPRTPPTPPRKRPSSPNPSSKIPPRLSRASSTRP